jgi:RHS repeat-associated protein
VEEAEIAAGTGWRYAYVSQTTKLEYVGVAYAPDSNGYPTTYRAKVRRSVYDLANQTGNILKSIDLGEVSLGTTSNAIAGNILAHTYTNLSTADDLYIHTSYAGITNHPEIVNKIASTRTTSDEAGNDKLKEIVFTYDGLGRVLTEKTWLDKTRDGAVNRYTTTSQYGYDSYGNRSYSIDKAGIRTDTTYDSQYHMFPVEKTTGTFVTSTDYEIRSGLPVRTIDPAGMVAQSQYDSLFRLTDAFASTEPNGQPDLWLTHIDYSLGGINNGISHNYVHQIHAGYEAYTYSDGLGRVVQTRTRAEPNAPGEDPYRVVSTCYDSRGNVGFQTLPFFSDGNDYLPPSYYRVYLDTSVPLTDGDLVSVQSGTAFEPNALAYGTTYHWQVKRFGSNGELLEQGDPWQFTTGSAGQAGWRDPENPAGVLSGLQYTCYDDAFPWWQQLPDFSTLYPCKTGTTSTFTAGVSDDTSTFGIRFTGYISITTGGQYTFYTNSDDGSRLYLGDTLVVDNDGLRLLTPIERSGAVNLKAGTHAITVIFFRGLAGSVFTVSYQGPDTSNAKIAIPSGVLHHNDANAAPTPHPYHQQSDVSITPRLSWEGLLPAAQWDDAYAGVHTEYDALGRVWKVTPAGDETGSPTGPSTTVYGYQNDPWAEVSTDAEGKVTRKHFDAAGRVLQVVEVAAAGDITTSYEYDRLGRLITTTDHASNEFTAEYDSLDRKIRSIDPDMGTWTYAYDDAGRMLDQVDARGNKIEFSYNDELGRVTQKVVKNAGQQVVETIAYTYDQSDDPAYMIHKGQVYKVTDGQGWTKTGYDSRGRAIKSTRYLSANDKSYTTQTAYDVADRVTQVTYPDTKAVIGYGYDEASHLVRVESLWGTGANEVFYQAGGFNELHQETTVAYGNGRTTQNEYYAHTRRLKRMTTGGGSTIQDISYTYDKVSNLLSVTDAAHTGAPSCSLSNIQYDDLYRLTSLYSTSENRTITYEYTAIGNINVNGEMGTGAYTYSTTQPHAVTAANGSAYGYDAAGNMTTRNRSGQANQTLTYDEENRLKQVAIAGGSTIQFGYSAGGARLWKKVNSQITNLWIGSLYEEKNGKILCHVYAGGQLVATFEPQGGFACVIENNRYFAALWHTSGRAFKALFGGGHMPVTVMWAAALTGIVLGLRYNRRKLFDRYGLQVHYGLPAFGGTDPWRQMVLLTLAAAVFLSSNPQAAYAGTPVYDPVFYYYHPDHLGSSQLMTDRDGDVVQQYGYSPFGRENYKNNTQAFSLSNRYTGQTLDEDTGLYHYGARYYDPELGRFIQADSTIPDPEFSQAYNRYAYCYNNPLKFNDPTGQNPFVIAFIIGAYMGGAQGLATGGIKGMLVGAFLGGATALLSAGVGMAVGGWASGYLGTLGSAVAGTTAGFAASYTVRGAISGNWAFTTMDGINLAIAIVFCLLDPRPGVSVPVDQQNVAAQEATDGIDDAVGGTSANALVEVKIESWIGEPSDGILPTATTVNVTQWTRGDDGTWTSEAITYIEEYGHIALSAAGTVDPTPFCDTVNTVWYLVEGDLSNASLSAVSALPYLGDIIGKGGQAALAMARRTEGVYQFTATSRKIYVGQSRFLGIRLWTHRWTGKLPAGRDVTIWEMPGSTSLERRIMEQTRMNDLGGLRGGRLDNKIDSIRESDWLKYGIDPPK